MNRSTIILCIFICGNTFSQSDDVEAPIRSESDLHTFEFKIPAPRGLITDRTGKPLAHTEAIPHLAIYLPALGDAKSNESPVSATIEKLSVLKELEGLDLKEPTENEIKLHWKHRRFLPMIVTGAKADPKMVESIANEFSYLKTEIRYARRYDTGEAFSHIVGYVRPSMPEQYGPLNRGDLKWPGLVAETGLEKSYSEKLAGTDGTVNFLYNAEGDLTNREFARLPRAGKTVVTTLNLEMQNLAFNILKKTGRPGAFVALDYQTGDILAMATYPSFASNDFVNGISQAKYGTLRDHPNAPLFNRAYQGAYPPGSTFKPFVGIAAMDTGVVFGTSTTFEGPPFLMVDGRRFNNWNDDHEGTFDIRYALMRSSNTWFYQAGIYTGSRAIIETAQRFGFGKKPGLNLEAVTSGNLPDAKTFMVRQGIANLSIGQGDVLASPLQLASAMGGIANGEFVAEPRIVLQVQSSLTNEPEGAGIPKLNYINFRQSDLNVIRAGMWAVVNHQYGTGKAAAHSWPDVYGKTGTSQWSTGGETRPMVWFSGFVREGTPRIAFAVMLQGDHGEVIYGGRNAAPLAGEFLTSIYGSPEKFGVTVPPRSENSIFTQSITESQSVRSQIDDANQAGRIMSDTEVRSIVNQRRFSRPIGSTVGARPVEEVNTPQPRKEDASVLKKIGRFLNR